jgi:hypothetical protein
LTKKGTLQESWHRDFQWPATAPAALYTAVTNSVTLSLYLLPYIFYILT